MIHHYQNDRYGSVRPDKVGLKIQQARKYYEALNNK